MSPKRATHLARLDSARGDVGNPNATAGDSEFLEAMLFEAFFWNPAFERPALSAFRSNSEFAKLLSGWGRPGDWAAIAEDDHGRIGAAWFRLWTTDRHSYGFVDADTPELGLAVSKDHRRRGVGRALLGALIDHARADGYPALSLSVDPANPSRGLYESVGFLRVGAAGTSWTFRLPFR
jgi:ribosomal protein S18 acetylase RimI-like enzyme